MHVLSKNLKEDVLKKKILLDGVNLSCNIRPQRFHYHLNSSQIMCINFFQPLLRDEGKKLLLEILKEELQIKIEDGATISKTCFEYVPCKTEGTNFDFYIKLSSEEQIYFEIKYTENYFGKIATNIPIKYTNKWTGIYEKHLGKSLCLKNMKKEEFYKDYQLWRNVSYIRDTKDYVVFLIPYLSDSLKKEVEKTNGKQNVITADWCSFISSALELSKDTDYHAHFTKFNEKYLNFLPCNG